MLGFKKASKPSFGWDLHAHLVPGVDDGVRTLEESLDAIRGLKELGYQGCIVTPHIYKDCYDNSKEKLQTAFEALKAAVYENAIDFRLQLAAEYFGDEHFIHLAEKSDLLTFGPPERPHVLIEFPYIGEPLYWADVLSAAIRSGFQPVIAHPERYRYLAADLDSWLEKFGNYPIKYQCDIGSYVGQYGPDPMRTLRKLKETKAPLLWGTDLHRPSQIARFIRPAIEKLGFVDCINKELGTDQLGQLALR